MSFHFKWKVTLLVCTPITLGAILAKTAKTNSNAGKWLNTNLSLHEQGVGLEDGVVLKKKFFVSDANVDTNNPAQVHFVYIQVWRTASKSGMCKGILFM